MRGHTHTRAGSLLLPFCAMLACQSGLVADGRGRVTRGRDACVSAETRFDGMRGRYEAYGVRISNKGIAATGRLLRPAATTDRRYPAVLLENGRELNSRAIDFLPAEFGDVVVLSLDYPEELPYELSVREIILESDRLRGALRRIVPAFSVGADYLVARGDVDASRLVIVASSFAVPFAVNAAARDKRFVNVGLVYGAGNMADVLEANLTIRPRWMRRAAAWIATLPFAEFAPERHVSRIAPRPIVMVNGLDDPQMPRSAVEALYHAASDPKSLVWLRTGHLQPDDSALVRELVDTTLARLPALKHAPGTPSEGGSSSKPGTSCLLATPQSPLPERDMRPLYQSP